MNNSNGGCPSPVCEYYNMCSKPELWSLIMASVLLLSVIIQNVFQGSSSAPFVIVPWRNQGMPPVTSPEIHEIPSSSL